MSSFRFTDLPEDVGILIAQEVVGDFRIEIYEQEVSIKRTQSRLIELSVTNSIFTKPAQAQLFRCIIAKSEEVGQRFLQALQSNFILGFLVKEMKMEFGRLSDSLMERVALLISKLLISCPSLTSLVEFGLVIPLARLLETKKLKYLKLTGSILAKSEGIINVKNLKSLHLLATIFIDTSEITMYPFFSSLSTLEIMDFNEIEGNFNEIDAFKGLSNCTQIKDLSTYHKDLDWLVKDDGILESFTSLKNIEFYFSGPSFINNVIEVIARIPFSLMNIRFIICSIDLDKWRMLQEALWKRKTRSISIFVGSNNLLVHPESSNNPIILGVRSNMEKAGIKIKICDDEKDFESWLEMIGESIGW